MGLLLDRIWESGGKAEAVQRSILPKSITGFCYVLFRGFLV